jgi:(E)-4-hydroxy-3-methylbut-2-enyl-diphosphate synthase
MHELDLFLEVGFDNVKIAVKASDVPLMIGAYRLLAETTDHPLHLGVTEAGPPPQGLIKSVAGIGTLLAEGIGDTIRFSLTADPVEGQGGACAARVARPASARARPHRGPSCGRAEVDVIGIAPPRRPRSRAQHPLQVRSMGCVVNGPGEAQADLGIAGGRGKGTCVKGHVVRRAQADMVAALVGEKPSASWPKGSKRASPAAGEAGRERATRRAAADQGADANHVGDRVARIHEIS